jgi:tRNA dimethylallyltransferase
MMKPLVVILGPTAVGKTAVGIRLCQKIPAEIVSGDSMLLYRGMDIGTAKPTPDERQDIPHHMIDILDPDESYSVAEFQAKATECIQDIQRRGRIPVLLGGTGLYVRAIIEGYQFAPAGVNSALRETLQQEAENFGNEYVWNKLQAVDAATAARLHPNDVRRIIRALEVYCATGIPLSQQYTATYDTPYTLVLVGLTMPRELLYQRINARVDLMIAQGLEQEVRQMLAQGYEPDSVSMQGLGYRQMVGYLNEEYDFAHAVYLIKRDTRHFAKRQMTLFKSLSDIRWFDVTEYASTDHLVEQMLMLLQESFGFSKI